MSELMLEAPHRTTSPLLTPTAETRQGAPAISLKRILVTSDFSVSSKAALRYAAALAQEFGAEILLIHVVPTMLPTDLSHLGLTTEEKRLIHGAKDLLPFVREAELDSKLPVRLQVLNGTPAEEICKAAKENASDLIVIATHGNTGLKHFCLGSVAEKVVRHAPCPVLVVRQKEHDFLIPPPESALNE